jgi:hypothetical protein
LVVYFGRGCGDSGMVGVVGQLLHETWPVGTGIARACDLCFMTMRPAHSGPNPVFLRMLENVIRLRPRRRAETGTRVADVV